MLMQDLALAVQVLRTLQDLGVACFLGGSLASSFHGVPRSTQDADLVADLATAHVRPMVEALGKEFYLSEERIREAILRRSSFNLIHLQSGFKVDIFVLRQDPLSRSEMQRRQRTVLQGFAIDVSSPEDTILKKLLWYELGGGTSERQWSDLLGIVKVQGAALDQGYLELWAERVGVQDLLERLLSQRS